MEHLSTKDIALDLGLHTRTVRKYCQTGFLPSRQIWINGNSIHQVDNNDYLDWKSKHFSGLKRGQINKYTNATKELLTGEVLGYADEWIEWCLTGKLTGKPLAKRTTEIYMGSFKLFLKKLGPRAPKPIVSIDNIRTVLGLLPIESFTTRRNIYDAMRSFSKFLVEKGLFEEEFRDKLKKLKPRRFLPPRKTSLTKPKVEMLLKQADLVTSYSDYDLITTKTLIEFFVGCGLRNSEACNLKLHEVDLESRVIHINLGKGNKNRKVGIPNHLHQKLVKYLKARLKTHKDSEHDNFFLNKDGAPFNNDVIARKVKRLSRSAGLDITPHGLRRTFASLYSASGKPLNHLRIALGHADLSTTQSYIMTTESEVIEAMRGW